MTTTFQAAKPDARILLLQIVLVSVMSFSMQNMVAMMVLFALTDFLNTKITEGL